MLPLLFTFFALVPNSLLKTHLAWLAIWTPALALAAWCLPRLYHHIYHPPTLTNLPPEFHFSMSAMILTYGLGALVALWINYSKLPSDSQRRDLRLFAIGSTLGLLPLFFFLTAIFAGAITQSPFVWFFVSAPFRHLTLASFILFPIFLLYSILRQDLFISANVTSEFQEKDALNILK